MTAALGAAGLGLSGAAAVGVLAEVAGPRMAFAPFALAAALLVVSFLRVITPAAVAAAEAARPEPTGRPAEPRPPLSSPTTSRPGPYRRCGAPYFRRKAAAMTTSQYETVRTRLWLALPRLAIKPTSPRASLAELRVDSLALLRIVIDMLGSNSDVEIDGARLGSVRTVADLKDYLSALTGEPAGSA